MLNRLLNEANLFEIFLMSDLKFTCASCGQHIQCDQDYANERIPCPNCGAVVRVPVDAPIVTPAPIPEAVHPAAPTSAALVPTLEDNFGQESGAPAPSTPPMTEREQQIAAARAARPVIPMPTVKPRLSYILNGGEAPAKEENEHATHPEQKPPEECPHTKSFHE
jgi:DNA-directed RNA polymerase subunit RPC12/RpoP